MEQHYRDSSTHCEGNSEIGLFEISESDKPDFLLYAPDRCHWSFTFIHASKSSKCILFAIRCLFQINRLVKMPRATVWIVNEMIDWLKVRANPALITKIIHNPDNWEESNSGSSTAGSLNCLDGRCMQENRKSNSDSEAEEY